MNEMELRYGDCTVKKLSGGTLSASMRNLEKYRYAGTPLGTIRLTAEFGRPVGVIEKNSETNRWYFAPEGEDPYAEREGAAGVMSDIRAFVASREVEA